MVWGRKKFWKMVSKDENSIVVGDLVHVSEDAWAQDTTSLKLRDRICVVSGVEVTPCGHERISIILKAPNGTTFEGAFLAENLEVVQHLNWGEKVLVTVGGNEKEGVFTGYQSGGYYAVVLAGKTQPGLYLPSQVTKRDL